MYGLSWGYVGLPILRENAAAISFVSDILYVPERDFESFGRAYDNWYDCFIESDILPLLKRIAYEVKEGE